MRKKYVDWNGNTYTKKQLLQKAKDKWEFLNWQGDYYFTRDYSRKKLKDIQVSLAFLNNYYELDNRLISFKEKTND